LSGFAWLFVGVAVGAAHGGLLWHALRGVRPGGSGMRSAWLAGTGLLRALGVALVLLLALQHGLAAGLWALLGVALARYVWLWRSAR